MKNYLPLLIVEIYLLLTLVIFYFGPVEYNIHHPFLLLFLMFAYHACFIFGYLLAYSLHDSKKVLITEYEFSDTYYWWLFCFSFIAIWVGYKNIVMVDGLIPYNFFDNLIRGFSEPGLVYVERMINLADAQSSSSRLFNVFSIFFAFAKYLFIFYFIYFWTCLSRIKKIISLIYSFLFISAGISAGVNSIIFLFFIFSALSLLVVLYQRRYIHLRKILIFASLFFLLPMAWFGKIMSERGGGFENFAFASPLGDIRVISDFVLSDNPSIFDLFYYAYVWLSFYVCHGYYGFSLIFDLDFNWTYGFGNSEFLQRQFTMITGVDLAPFTFQFRNDHIWDKSAQWHTFYGQFANDVGLIGLAFLMFLIGFYFARVWKSIVRIKSFYGMALMPIFGIMFIFFPANNQVFGYIDTFSYFLVLSLLWFFSSRKIRI